MKRKVMTLAAVFAALAVLVSCGSGAQPKAKKGKKEKVPYVKGNTFADKFGADNPLVLHHAAKFEAKDMSNGIKAIPLVGDDIYYFPAIIPFASRYVEYPASADVAGKIFYTGKKEANGEDYKWLMQVSSVSCLGELIGSGSAFTEPVYVYNPDSMKNPVPLMAVINNGMPEVTWADPLPEDAFQVGIDIIDRADIWYCCNMPNQIRNEYFKLSAYGVVIGEVAYAQAKVNGILLKDIAVLTGAKAGLSELDTDIEYTDEELATIKENIAKLDGKIKDKLKLNKQMTKAVGKAIGAAIAQGIELGATIAKDVARLTQMTLARDVGGIAQYFIELYGTEKEVQEFGKFADKQAKVNFDYGMERMKAAQELLKKNEAQFNAIMADD